MAGPDIFSQITAPESCMADVIHVTGDDDSMGGMIQYRLNVLQPHDDPSEAVNGSRGPVYHNDVRGNRIDHRLDEITPDGISGKIEGSGFIGMTHDYATGVATQVHLFIEQSDVAGLAVQTIRFGKLDALEFNAAISQRTDI